MANKRVDIYFNGNDTGFNKTLQDMQTKLSKTMSVMNTMLPSVVVGGFSIAGFKTIINNAEQTGSAIDDMATRMSMSTDQYQFMDYMLQRCGMSIDTFGAGMKTIEKQVYSAINGNKETVEMFNALGVSVVDASGKIRKIEDVMLDVISALQKMPDSVIKSNVAFSMFGKSGQSLKVLLDGTKTNVSDLKEEFDKLNLKISNESIQAAAEYGDTIDAFNYSTRALSSEFATIFLPTLSEMNLRLAEYVSVLNSNVQSAREWLNTNKETVNTVNNAIVSFTTFGLTLLTLQKSTTLLTSSYVALTTCSGKVSYAQAAISDILSGRLKQGLTVALVGVQKLTASLLVNPWTIVLVGISAVVAGYYSFKRATEEAVKSLEKINQASKDSAKETRSLIYDLENLAQKTTRNAEENEKFEETIRKICNKYPDLSAKLIQEAKLHGKITEALWKEIAAREVNEKLKNIDNQIDKQKENFSNPLKRAGSYWFGHQFKDTNNTINLLLEERNKIVNSIPDYVKNYSSLYGTSNISSGTYAPKINKSKSTKSTKSNDAEKRLKEELDLKIAYLDKEIILAKGNNDKIFALEKEKIAVKLAYTKKGTSDYQNLLNEELRLIQNNAAAEIELKAKVLDYQHEIFKKNNEVEQTQWETNNSKANELTKLERKKLNLKKEIEYEENYLNKKIELYKNDAEKYAEFEQEKLMLALENKQKMASIDAEIEVAKKADLNELLQSTKDVITTINGEIGNSIQSVILKTNTINDAFQNVLNKALSSFTNFVGNMIIQGAKLIANKAFDWMINSGNGVFATIGTIGKFFTAKKYATGGIIDGNYNTPVPIVAHGSEMVLNPTQQASLFNYIDSNMYPQQPVVANSQSNAADNSRIVPIVNNIQIQAFDAKDVKQYLIDNKELLNNLTVQGIKSDSRVRGAIKSIN